MQTNFLIGFLLLLASNCSSQSVTGSLDNRIYMTRPDLANQLEFDSRINFIAEQDSFLVIGLEDKLIWLRNSDLQEMFFKELIKAPWWRTSISDGVVVVSGTLTSSSGAATVNLIDATSALLMVGVSTAYQFCTPAFSSGFLLIGDKETGVTAYSTSGSQIWRWGSGPMADSGSIALSWSRGLPYSFWWPRILSIHDSVAVIGLERKSNGWTMGSTPRCTGLVGLDLESGEQLWLKETETFELDEILLSNDLFYIPFLDSLNAYSINSGDLTWTFQVDSISGLSLNHDRLCATKRNLFLQLSAESGELIRSDSLRTWPDANQLPVSDFQLCRSRGEVILFDLDSGLPLWALSLGGPGESSFTGNRLYLSVDNRLYVFQFPVNPDLE